MSFDHQALGGQAAAWVQKTQATIQPFTSITQGKVHHLPLPPLPPKMADLVSGFGGRKERFKEHRQQMLRAWDPIAQTYLTFSHERYYHAFLLMRFSPEVRGLKVSPKALSYKRGDTTFTARADLMWVDERKVAHYLWLNFKWTTEERARYEHFAVTHKVVVQLMAWGELEQSRPLLDNLESARQLMTTTAHAGVDLTCAAKAVHAHMARRDQCTRGELGAELTCEGCIECAEHLDATLFHLHVLGSIHLSLAEQDYGDDTVIMRR